MKIEYFQGGGERSAAPGLAHAVSAASPLKANAPAINTRVETYLPDGADWYDFWTNEPSRAARP